MEAGGVGAVFLHDPDVVSRSWDADLPLGRALSRAYASGGVLGLLLEIGGVRLVLRLIPTLGCASECDDDHAASSYVRGPKNS
jgi:hypothetical protein